MPTCSALLLTNIHIVKSYAPPKYLCGKDSDAYITGIYTCHIYKIAYIDDNLQQKEHLP